MPVNSDVVTGGTNEKGLDFSFGSLLKFASALQGILFKRQEAIRKAQLDGWAAILGEIQKLYPSGTVTLKKNRAKDYFNEVQHEYKHWKDDINYLKGIMVDHYNRIIKDNPIQNFSTMAKIMTYEDFIKMSYDPDMIASSQCGVPMSQEYAMVLYAQACHETGRFTSTKYTRDGNMFGMMASSSRLKLYVSKYEVKTGGEKGWWPEYRDQFQSFCDRRNWDVYTRIQYIDVMQYINEVMGDNEKRMKYATDPQYIAKWVGWINKVHDEAGMRRPYIRGYSDNNQTDGVDPIKPTDTATGGTNIFSSWDLNWKMWAPIAAILAIVVYWYAKRD